MTATATTTPRVVVTATASADIGIVSAGWQATVARGDEVATTLWRGATTQRAAVAESSAEAGTV